MDWCSFVELISYLDLLVKSEVFSISWSCLAICLQLDVARRKYPVISSTLCSSAILFGFFFNFPHTTSTFFGFIRQPSDDIIPLK